MQLEDLNIDAYVRGLVPGRAVRVVQVKSVGPDAYNVTYRDDAGALGERLVFRNEADGLAHR